MRRSDQQYDPWGRPGPRETGQSNRLAFLVIGGLIGLVALAICAGAAYFFLSPALSELEQAESELPAVPTASGGETTDATEPAASATTSGATAPAEPPVSEATQVAQVTATNSPPPPTTGASPTTSPPTPTSPPAAAPGTVLVVSAPNPPAIDGTAGDWPSAPPVQSPHRVYAHEQWDGSSDLEVEWRLAWDAANLYIFANIVDNVHVQTQTGTQIYRGDSLEIQVDTNPATNARQVNPATYQIIFSPGNFADLPGSVVRFRGAADGDIPEAPGHAINFVAQKTARGYQAEAAIPWRDLNVAPAAGMVLGLALNANDNDTPGTAVQEVMVSNVTGRRLTDPSTWGILILQ